MYYNYEEIHTNKGSSNYRSATPNATKNEVLSVDVGNFIRLAISEKLERDKHEILKPKEENICPF